MRTGTNELHMIACFSPDLIYSKSCQTNEDCCWKWSLPKPQVQRLEPSRSHLVQLHGKETIFWSHLRQSLLCHYATECHTHPVTNPQGLLLWGSACFSLRYILNAIEVHCLLPGPQQMRYWAQSRLAQWPALDMHSTAPYSQSKPHPLLDRCCNCNSLKLVYLNHHLPLILVFLPIGKELNSSGVHIERRQVWSSFAQSQSFSCYVPNDWINRIILYFNSKWLAAYQTCNSFS